MLNQYTIDLDLPSDQCWLPVLTDYREKIRECEKQVDTLSRAHPFITNLGCKILSYTCKQGLVMYHEELKAIAKFLDLPLGKIVAIQLVYELLAGCTTIAINSQSGTTLVRTMDWDMSFLKQLTIDVIFVKDHKQLFQATTWAGYIGILTGYRFDHYALAMNFRSDENLRFNRIMSAITGNYPVGFLCRDVLTKAETFNDANQLLCQSALITPCYFTLVGKQIAHVIVRDTRNYKVYYYDLEKEFAVQTNIDPLDEKPKRNILWSKERQDLVKEYLQSQRLVSITDLWQLISQPPIKNIHTIYQCIICIENKMYESKIN